MTDYLHDCHHSYNLPLYDYPSIDSSIEAIRMSHTASAATSADEYFSTHYMDESVGPLAHPLLSTPEGPYSTNSEYSLGQDHLRNASVTSLGSYISPSAPSSPANQPTTPPVMSGGPGIGSSTMTSFDHNGGPGFHDMVSHMVSPMASPTDMYYTSVPTTRPASGFEYGTDQYYTSFPLHMIDYSSHLEYIPLSSSHKSPPSSASNIKLEPPVELVPTSSSSSSGSNVEMAAIPKASKAGRKKSTASSSNKNSPTASSHKKSHSGSPGAPPGPIPASTPTLVRRDERGIEWIAFEYSKERVKSTYTIRCDIETIDISYLSNDFKKENCIYPRATVPPSEYTGNRQKYETECNCIGWCLSHLNPALRGQRGLIQRAVDSWRNTNADPSFRSRRVKRMSKRQAQMEKQMEIQHQTSTGPGVSTIHFPFNNQSTIDSISAPAFTNPFSNTVLPIVPLSPVSPRSVRTKSLGVNRRRSCGPYARKNKTTRKTSLA